MLCSSVTGRQSTLGSMPQSKPVEHGPRHSSSTVTKQILQGSVVVVVVVGHGPQSCGHVEQSSEDPHSPSPHTQLQDGDPPVQLQRPSLQSAMTCLTQAPLACPLSPLAATSSLQA